MFLSRLAAVAVAVLLFAAPQAFAHPVGGTLGGFATGFVHPFGGLDHLLAMAAIGLWAARLGERARWGVPLAFLAVMALAGLAGMNDLVPSGIWAVETGAAASVAALGILLALGVRLPLSASAALAGLFAVAHGLAHGAEMPLAATPAAYALGFVAASAVLHALGFAASRAADQIGEKAADGLARAGGGAIAAVGVALLVL